jgi:hypothetical protein
MSSTGKCLVILFVFATLVVKAQVQTPPPMHSPLPEYPKDYFRNPLDIPILLAGNFGECRANHFHGGLDIKTEGKENMPVKAAADGYVARVKIEKAGYGHVIYINHPNGFTTVYAHLNSFMKSLEDYVHKEQYNKETAELDISFKAGEFPVKKGQQIALSGNTGSSTAPHLHFEIRQTEDEHSLNPQLFGFDINDKIAPKPLKLGIYDLTRRIYEQTPAMYPLQQKGNGYWTIPDTIVVASEQTGIGVVINDFMNGSDNTLTYHVANMYMNDALTITIRLNNIGNHDTRYMNAYADYKQKQLTGEWVQCMFQMDGNLLDHIYEYTSSYKKLSQKGKLEAGAGSIKQIKLEFIDANENSTSIFFYMKVIPANNQTPITSCSNKFMFSNKNTFSNEEVAIIMDEYSIYESLCFDYSSKTDPDAYSKRLQLHRTYVPVQKDFGLYMNATKPVPAGLENKIALIYNDGKDDIGKAAEHNDGWYKATVRKFGEYRLVLDTIPPIVKPQQPDGANLAKAGEIVITAMDATTSVSNFRAELNGKWLCFEARMGNKFVYKFDERCPKGKNKLNIVATDENGNKQTMVYNFTR